MALGRQGEQQTDLMVGWAELPRSPGHAFYDRLQAILINAGFDAFAERQCAAHYAGKRGRPSLPPGRYFRMHLVGYFEGIDSERGLEWRCGAAPTACPCARSCGWARPSRCPITPG
jgi:transposase